MNQKTAAEKMEVYPTAISRILVGRRNVGIKMAKKIATLLQDNDWRKYIHISNDELRKLLRSL
jgi:plasmid maintenance system antidote protein VapI